MSLDTPGGLLLAFVVLDQQPRDGGAQRGLARLKRQPDLCSSIRFVAACGEREDPVRGVPELRQRASRGTGSARASAAPRQPPLRALSALSRSPRIRSNCADHAVSGYGSSLSSMSRMARPRELRSFWMRSSCSESVRLRSARSVCSARRLGNLARHVPRHADDGAKRHARPSSSAGVGDRPSAARLAPITTPASGVPSTARQCNRWWAVRRRARGAASRSGRGGNGCAWRPA